MFKNELEFQFEGENAIFIYRLLTKNEQKKMNDTKYAYAMADPQSSPCLFDFESHGPLRHANIMFGHASPVAHLQFGQCVGK